MEDLKEEKVNDEKNWKWKLKKIEIAEVIKKKRAVVSSIKSLEADIMRVRVLLLKRKVICHFLPKHKVFHHTLRKKSWFHWELDCAVEKWNYELENI